MSYTIGKNAMNWRKESQTVTFIVTEDCNLRCKYCYVTHKSSDKKMNFEIAKKFIDYLLSDKINRQEFVILEFFGGEPLLEIELIDKICDYFKMRTYDLGDEWYWKYRISIPTNGVNYSNPEVQKFIKKNKNKVSLGITIDGTKEKHDLNRVKTDGTGSYDDIKKNIALWESQFIPFTKVTFSSDDLIYLKDSIKELWEMGIKDISANVVFENAWKQGDDKILESQLFELADYIIDNKLMDFGYTCSFFSENSGTFYGKEQLNSVYCGSGKMLALDSFGNIFPCARFAGYSMNKQKEIIVGNVFEGLDKEKIRPLLCTTVNSISDEECLNCPIGNGCSYCQGHNYDESKEGTCFNRTKYHCAMEKARQRANEYYFAKIFNEFSIERENQIENFQYLYFILDNDYISFCSCKNMEANHFAMDISTIRKGLEFCRKNFYKPVFLHSSKNVYFKNEDFYSGFKILHIMPIESKKINDELKEIIYVIDENENLCEKIDTCIYNIQVDNLAMLSDNIISIFKYARRINLNIHEVNIVFDEFLYRLQLEKISKYIEKTYLEQGILKELNVLIDIFFENQHQNCKSGDRLFAISPDGSFYLCPISYSETPQNKIGFIDDNIESLHNNFFSPSKKVLCEGCLSFQCFNCICLNRKTTGEFNISSSLQCRKSHIENQVSFGLQNRIPEAFKNGVKIEFREILDPMDVFLRKNNIKGSHFNY